MAEVLAVVAAVVEVVVASGSIGSCSWDCRW